MEIFKRGYDKFKVVELVSGRVGLDFRMCDLFFSVVFILFLYCISTKGNLLEV